MESLTTPVDATLKGQYERRDRAIDAVAAYCLVEEGPAVNPTRSAASTRRPVGAPHGLAESPLHIAVRTVFIKKQNERPRICFLCVSKALSLPPNDPQIDNLIRDFHAPSDLTKHFKRKYLAYIREGDRLECTVCQMSLQYKMDIQSHAYRIHKTIS